MDESRLAGVARTQFGVFTRAQALACGWPSQAITRTVRRGSWVRLHGEVLCASTTRLSIEGREWAAYLAAGDGAVLSGPSAARRLGVEVPARDPCVTVPTARHLRMPGVTVLREPVVAGDRTHVGGLCVSTLPRTVVDCLRVLPRAAAADLLSRALRQQLITLEELEVRIAAHRGRKGAGELRALAASVVTGSRSEGERRLHQVLIDAGIDGWSANVPIQHNGTRVAVADVLFPDARLVIEFDGRAWHSDSGAFQRDRIRQNRLVGAGLTVLRFTWEDVVARPERVVAEVRAALERLAS
jgi:very-short-patch-repair endonuclease